MVSFKYSDGGRADAGFKGTTNDCVCRAVAIGEDADYKEVYRHLSKHIGKGKSVRSGIDKKDLYSFMEARGWVWVPTSKVGSKERVHLVAEELPKGRIIVRVSKHVACVIDGVLYDNHDDRRDGKRMVYGYWTRSESNE